MKVLLIICFYITQRKNLCFTLFSTRIYWNRNLAPSDLFLCLQSQLISVYSFCHILTLFRMGLLGAAHEWVDKKGPFLKAITYVLQWWNLVVIPYLKKIKKIYINHVIQPLSSVDNSIFSSEVNNFCYIKKCRYRLHFNTYLILLTLFWIFKGCFSKHGCNFGDVSKFDYPRPS